MWRRERSLDLMLVLEEYYPDKGAIFDARIGG